MQQSISALPIAERRAISIREAQSYSGLSRATLYRRIEAGEIRKLKVGRKALIDRASLDRLLDGAVAA